MSIECTEFRSNVKGCMLGFANLFIPKMGLEIYGCSLWQKDGRRWINLPNREYKDSEGNVKYASIIRFRDKDHYEGFANAAKDAIDTWCQANSNKEEVEPETQIDTISSGYAAHSAPVEPQNELPF